MEQFFNALMAMVIAGGLFTYAILLWAMTPEHENISKVPLPRGAFRILLPVYCLFLGVAVIFEQVFFPPHTSRFLRIGWAMFLLFLVLATVNQWHLWNNKNAELSVEGE